MRVFASKGFFGAKVADIAKDAGVADGTIYLYFKSKDDLLISLFEEQMTKVNRAMEAALDGCDDPAEKLRRFVTAYCQLIQDNRLAAEVLTIELRQSAKFMKEYSNPRFADYLKLLASVVQEGQRRGVFADDVPPPIVARGLFGLLDELATMWVSDREGKTEFALVASWVNDIVLKGLQRRRP